MPIVKISASEMSKRGIHYLSIPSGVVKEIKNTDALAIWAYSLTQDKTWRVRPQELMEHFSIGRDKTRKAIKCLIELGLVKDVVIFCNDTHKVLDRSYHFYSMPINHEPENQSHGFSREPENHEPENQSHGFSREPENQSHGFGIANQTLNNHEPGNQSHEKAVSLKTSPINKGSIIDQDNKLQGNYSVKGKRDFKEQENSRAGDIHKFRESQNEYDFSNIRPKENWDVLGAAEVHFLKSGNLPLRARSENWTEEQINHVKQKYGIQA